MNIFKKNSNQPYGKFSGSLMLNFGFLPEIEIQVPEVLEDVKLNDRFKIELEVQVSETEISEFKNKNHLSLVSFYMDNVVSIIKIK